jgi:hypothetical protein
MKVLTKGTLERGLVVCWSLLFMGGCVGFCFHLLQKWQTFDFEYRTNALFILFFGLALLVGLVKTKCSWILVMTAAMLFQSASFLVFH